MGRFVEFIVSHTCPKCGKEMHFRSQVNGFDDAYREFYIGDYVGKANVNMYYDMEFAVNCEHCGEYISDLVFAIRNGQYVDVLTKEESLKKPIEEYNGIEEGYERRKIYDRYCEEMCGRDNSRGFDSPERILNIKVGDTINLLRHDWTINERFKVVYMFDHALMQEEDAGLFRKSYQYVYRAHCKDEVRLIYFSYNELTKRTTIDIYKNQISRTNIIGDYSELHLYGDSFLMPLDHDPFMKLLIDRFIWSNTLKVCIENLTDWDKAAIVYNLSESAIVRMSWLQEIARLTDDAELKEQITERIRYDRKALHTMTSDSDGFFYAPVMYFGNEEPHTLGYYKNYRDAEFRASDELSKMIKDRYIAGREDKDKFLSDSFTTSYEIEKYQIIDPYDKKRPIIRPRLIKSELMNSDSENAVEEHEYDAEPVASVRYNIHGHIIDYFSNEMPIDEVRKIEVITPKRFEHHFVIFPYPFKDGGMVRILGSSRVGRNLTGWADWKGTCRAYREGKYLDWSDTFLRVDFEDGDHDHVSMALLENIIKDDDNGQSK